MEDGQVRMVVLVLGKIWSYDIIMKIGNFAETLRRNYVGKVSHGGCVCAGAAWEKLCGGEHTGWQGGWGGRRRREEGCFKWGVI